MGVRALGYVGIDAADLTDWQSYAGVLGAVVVGSPEDGRIGLRIDERSHRVSVRRSDSGEGLAHVGWEVADQHALDRVVGALEAAGQRVESSTEAERGERRVRGLVHTTDPAGFALELSWGPILDHQPFRSPAGGAGFVTGDLGFGHIVLGVPDAEAALAFYTGLLGFRVSDYWRPDGGEVVFLHCNQRHHSLALVPAEDAALYHFMLEMATLDDVGYALDRHREHGVPISADLGRHPNDQMLSFYSRSPSGFDVEVGWGGRLVDDATWTVTEITKPSLWGHRPPT